MGGMWIIHIGDYSTETERYVDIDLVVGNIVKLEASRFTGAKFISNEKYCALMIMRIEGKSVYLSEISTIREAKLNDLLN